MNKPLTLSSALCLALLLSFSALADGAKVYKWTDGGGVVHYSDKPPADTAPDLQTMDFDLPPVDEQALAAAEARMASLQLTLQKQQAEEDLARQQRELAAKQAELDAALAALQQAAAAPPQPVIVAAAPFRFVPRHHEPDRDDFKRPQPKQVKSVVPHWPFPYNLSAGSFPEEQHRP